MNFNVLPSIPTRKLSQRKQFHNAAKISNESILDWYSRLSFLANECEFGCASAFFLLEKFIFGLDDDFLDRLSIEMDTITLEQSIEVLKYYEENEYQHQIQPISEVKVEEDLPHLLIKVELNEAIGGGGNDDEEKTLDKSFDFVGDNQLDGGDRLGDEQSDNDCATASDANIVSTSDTKPHKKLNKSTGKRKKPPRDPNAPKKLHYRTQQMIDAAPPEMEISADFKTFTCKICRHSSNRRRNVYAHIQNHLNNKTYICEYCGKGFVHGTNYKDHVKAHTGVRDYHCDQCPKSFLTIDVLKVHKRSHTDQKPYVCSTCGKRFRQRTGLYYHKRTHTGEKPHVCKFCGKAFSQTSSLKTHEKSQHQI